MMHTHSAQPARAVIVDDEPLARERLQQLIAAEPRLVYIGEASDGEAAVRLVEETAPDVLFLDVQMPVLSGLQVLAQLTTAPAVIFTTAHEQYAVSAFEHEAVDYLLKPFGRRRFEAAVSRVLRQVVARSTACGSSSSSSADQRAPALLTRIFVRHHKLIVPVEMQDVTRFEADRDYVTLWTRDGSRLIDLTMTELEQRLDPAKFRRIHRSHIVNLDAVTSIREFDERRFAVRLKDGTEIVASRSGSILLKDMIA